MSRRLKIFGRVGIGVFASLVLTAAGAQARTTFDVEVNPRRASVGDRIVFSFLAVSDEGPPDVAPGKPDWGGLELVGGPRKSSRTQLINGRGTYTVQISYILLAPGPGTYTIRSIEAVVDGVRHTASAIDVQVQPQDKSRLPAELRDDPILHPQTGVPDLDHVLEGRVFIRPVVSNPTPYIREPFVVSYYYYRDRSPAEYRGRRYNRGIPIDLYKMQQPEFEGFLTDVVSAPLVRQLPIPGKIESLGGRNWDVHLIHQVVLTPTAVGPATLPQFRVDAGYPIPRGIFSEAYPVDLPVSGVKIKVMDLPRAGKPDDFSGTVGDFTLTSEVDRNEASTDDLITLTLHFEGRGNPRLIGTPALEVGEAFEIYEDPIEEVSVEATSRGLVGSKTIEYILRPRKTGERVLPEIEYVVFNPERSAYERLIAGPHRFTIEPGASSDRMFTAGDGFVSVDESQLDLKLHYIKPIESNRTAPPPPLVEHPLFWLVQVGAASLAGFSFVRRRRLDGADRAQLRRERAWRALDKKIGEASRRARAGETEAAAMGLERALREFVADRYNLSPEGLTSEDVAQKLADEGYDAAQVERFRSILDESLQIRYAPPEAAEGDLMQAADAARELLRGKARA